MLAGAARCLPTGLGRGCQGEHRGWGGGGYRSGDARTVGDLVADTLVTLEELCRKATGGGVGIGSKGTGTKRLDTGRRRCSSARGGRFTVQGPAVESQGEGSDR